MNNIKSVVEINYRDAEEDLVSKAVLVMIYGCTSSSVQQRLAIIHKCG
jgi:hypothetical protein